MRWLVYGSALSVLLGCETKPSEPKRKKVVGAATLDELRARALEALLAADEDDYLELMGSPAFLLEHCPADPDLSALADSGSVARREQQRLSLRRALRACRDAFDWDRATVDRVEGGTPKAKTSLLCSPPAAELEDLTTFYRVDGAVWRVKVANDVYQVSDRYVVLDVPKCEQRDR